MDAFEQLVSEILWMEGYWVRTSVKVELTKEEKRLIGRHSSPRWELDICMMAYKGGENLLRVVECKSYIDSTGVRISRHLMGTAPIPIMRSATSFSTIATCGRLFSIAYACNSRPQERAE